MTKNTALKTELKKQLRECVDRKLPFDLLGTSEIVGLDEMSQYVNFIDTVGCREDLIRGLASLSPFADDALAVSKSMSEQDFASFKLALPFERLGEDSKMPERFSVILLPARFVPAILLAEKAVAPLGVTLVRILETELGIES